MKKYSVIGVICAVGLLVLLKIIGVGSSMMRINNPLSNKIVLIGAITLALVFGIAKLKKNR
jgi:hypothetical protein